MALSLTIRMPMNLSFLVTMSVDVCAIVRGSRRALTRRAVINPLRFPSRSRHNATTRCFSTSLSQFATQLEQQTHISKNSISQHPYSFHIGTSWAAKPDDPLVLRSRSPFPPDTVVGSWRDRMLTSSKKDPGEDFFFVQEASCLSRFTFFSN